MNSPSWFQRSVAKQAAATPGTQLTMLDGYDHDRPREVVSPILIDCSGAHRQRGPGTAPSSTRPIAASPVTLSGQPQPLISAL